jgi:hypothetical protein
MQGVVNTGGIQAGRRLGIRSEGATTLCQKNMSDIQVFVPNSGTSGTTIHKVVLDPTVHHAVKLVPSDRLVDDYQVLIEPKLFFYLFLLLDGTTPHKDIDLVNARCVTNATIYKHPIIPGCEGKTSFGTVIEYHYFVPREHNLMGQASEALVEFEKLQSADKSALHELLRIGAVQDAKWYPNTLG